MVKTLVVPLDGSPAAERALEPAERLARSFGAELHLISCTVGADPSTLEGYLRATAERVASYADQTSEVDVVVHGVTTSVSPFAFAAPFITETLASIPDPVLCMATHGRGGFGRLVLGSVADEVVGDTSAPVVLVGPDGNLGPLDGHQLLLTWEDLEIQPDLLATTKSWAAALDLEVTVAHVRGPNREDHELMGSPEWLAARHAVLDELDDDGIRADALIIDGVDVARKIIDHARTTPTALIVMGCRRHRRHRRGALDNVVLSTVKGAPCPIVVQAPIPTELT